jgi:tetratricopeptide (TPR) repeat protein
MKAIRKDPRQRYASVEQLAADIRRHLDGRPIEARADTLAYRCAKFIRRNAAAVAVGAAVLAAVTTAAVVAVRSESLVRAERARADQRIDDLRQLARSNLFELNDAIQALPGSAPARNLLIERTLQYLDHLNQDTTSRTRELQEELAVGYERIAQLQGNFSGPGIGDSRAALASYGKAIAIRRALAAGTGAGAGDLTALADLLTNDSMTLQLVGRTADAAEAARRALDAATRAAAMRPSDPPALTAEATAHSRLASVIGGTGSSASTREIADAIDHDRRALALLAAAPADPRVQTAMAHARMHLGFHLAKARDFADAARVFDALLARDRVRPVLDPGDRILAYNYRGMASDRAGEYRRALDDYRVQLQLARAAVAAAPGSLQAEVTRAIADADVGLETGRLGRQAEGMQEIREAVRVGERLLAANPAELFYADLLAVGYAYEAELLSSTGRQAEAEDRYRAALRMAARVARADPQDLESPLTMAKLHAALAAVMGRAGDYAPAERETETANAGLAALLHARPADAEAEYVATLNHDNASVLHACLTGTACDVPALRLPCVLN